MDRAGVEGPPTFAVAEAAERLGVSRCEVRGMIERGQLWVLRFAGVARVAREEVERAERELAERSSTP